MRDSAAVLVGAWADAAATWNAVLTGEPYPVVGAFNSSGNFWNQCNTTTTWEALKKLDFMWNATCGTLLAVVCATSLLPAAHFLELSSPRSSQGASGAMGATVK